MRPICKYISVVLFFLLSASVLSAQVKQSEHDPTFNALDYSLQKRWKPKNENYVSEKWADNTFVSLYWGTSQIAGSANVKYSWGGNYGVAYGKWFDHANGLRLTLHGEKYIRINDAVEVLSHGLQASYMLNLTSYMGGYRRSRFCELSMVTGLGFNLSTMENTFKPAGEFHLGLNTAMRFSRTLEFFMEPMAYFHTGSLTQLGTANWKKYNLGYGVNIGLTYSIVNEKAKRESLDYGKGSFVAVSYGPQFQNSEMVYDLMREDGILKFLGRHHAVSFGHWFAGWFALRGTAFYSQDTWCKYLDEYEYKTKYAGVRVEGMFEFLHMSEKSKIRHHFLSLAIGPEIGYMHKIDLMSSLLTPYIGLTAGLQYKFMFFKNLGVFLEPRFSVVPYTHDGPENLDVYVPGEKAPEKLNYYDSVVNLTAGIEIAF